MRSKRRRQSEPRFPREARSHERVIPSRALVLEALQSARGPVSFEELCESLGVLDEQTAEAFTRRLAAMQRDGQIVRNRRDKLGLAERMDLVRGRVISHRNGYGFLVVEDTRDGGARDDLFLSPREMRALMHGDRVLARTSADYSGRREASVVDVLERNTQHVVGHFFEERGICFVSSSSPRVQHDVLIAPEDRDGAEHRQLVVAELTVQPSKHHQPVGRIVEVLGEDMAPGMEIDVAIRVHDLPTEWPEQVGRETQALAARVPAEVVEARHDVRDLPLVTIDGADARDFDDAVYCERRARGWSLYVAIADVSHYVRPGTALDAEARRRGTSVYFPQRVVPMLPEVLSNGLCSLNPGEDRLCMICELSVSDSGRVTRSRFREAAMRSHARLTYDEVARLLKGADAKLEAKHRELMPALRELEALYRALRAARERRGAIDLDLTESRIVLDNALKVERIEPLERTDAHRLIEECMIAANVAAAEFLARHELALLYRVHDRPQGEKLADLRAFLAHLGLPFKRRGTPTPADYAKLLKSVVELPESRVIQMVILRSLSQAAYSPNNVGHFGLALDHYAHFTSPIRRYPDLLVHRAIRHALAGSPGEELELGTQSMDLMGEHCSMAERRADDATRDAVEWLKCEYMLDKVGSRYDGIVSAVTPFGLFVQLDEVYVEGLVHVSNLGHEYFHFHPDRHCLEGEATGTAYSLADKVKVSVSRVDLEERKIDLELVFEGRGQRRVRGRRGAATRSGARTRRKRGR